MDHDGQGQSQSAPSEVSSTPDVVIVGGGLAGLAAANAAARETKSVVLLEARSSVGGRARTDEFGGHRFNLGPHALSRSGHGSAVLADFKIDPVGKVPSGSQHVVDDRGVHALPSDARSLLRTSMLSGREKLEFGRLLGSLPRIDASRFAGQSVDEAVTELTGRRRVASFLHALIRLTSYGADHAIGCGAAAISQLKLAVAEGVLYLDDGWSQLVQGLAASAEQAGVVVVHGAEVGSITQTSGRFDIKTTAWSGTAASVVLAVAPAVADRLLGSGESLVNSAGPPTTVAVLDIAARVVPPRSFLLGLDERTYASVHSPPTNLAKSGAAVVCAMYLRDGERHDPEETRQLLKEQRRLLGLADADVIDERYMHRLVVTNGQPLASTGGMDGRPAVDGDDRPGAFIAGDWVGPDGLLADSSLVSGRLAGQMAADWAP